MFEACQSPTTIATIIMNQETILRSYMSPYSTCINTDCIVVMLFHRLSTSQIVVSRVRVVKPPTFPTNPNTMRSICIDAKDEQDARDQCFLSHVEQVFLSRLQSQFMLKFVDPWWYQQLPYVQVTLVPVREQPPNIVISMDQAFAGGSIGRHSTLQTCWS